MATMAVWPYIRAAITSVLNDMSFGGTSKLLPTITQRELAEAAAQAHDEDEDDLSADD